MGSDFSLGETMTALEPWKRHLVYLDGLAMYGPQWYFGNDDNEHGAGGNMVFTGAKKIGYATGPSVDQAIASFQHAQFPTHLRSLNLGVNTGTPSHHTAVFHYKGQAPVASENSVHAGFNLVFGGLSGGGNLKTDRAKQRSVLNQLSGDLARIRRLSGQQGRDVLDAHLTRISSLEQKLGVLHDFNPQPTAGCAVPASPANPQTLEATVQAQVDLIVAAFSCDITRSASLQLGVCDGGLDAAFGLAQDGVPAAVGEDPTSRVALDTHKKIDRWFAERWAYLLGQLASVPEGDGTMLDNTLVFFGSDTTTLQRLGAGAHFHERMPLWLAGGRNFAFKTGQALKLASPTALAKNPAELAKNWVPHHRLLTSICQAFGMNVDRFGNNDPGAGPVPQLTRV